MVSSKATAAILLVASAGSAMATIPASGQYTASLTDPTTNATLSALGMCDKACLSVISIAPNTAQTAVNMLGNAASGTGCTCTQVTVPYDSTNGLSFTGAQFSSGGATFSGTGDAKPVSSGTSSSSPAMPTSGTSTGNSTSHGNSTTNGNSTSSGNMTMTSMTSTATATSTATTTSSTSGLLLNVRRRRDIFARAVGDTLTVKLATSGGSAGTVVYVANGDAVGVTAPSSAHKTMYASAAAIVSAGLAAVIAGIVGL